MVAHESSDEFQDSRYRRRLVGAAVLIAFAVIFLPLIFDGSGTESQLTRISPLEDPPEFNAEILPEGELASQFGGTQVEFTDSGETLTLTQDARPPVTQVAEPDEAAAPEVNAPAAPAQRTESQARQSSAPETAPQRQTAPAAPVAEPAPEVRAPVAVAKSEPAPEPVADQSRWLIQVASFGDKINALTLRSDLRKKGYPVDVRAGQSGGQAVFRVSVGPVSGENEARRLKKEVEQALGRGTLLLPLSE
ncbi:SPOR domain-containing protein [Granulosicoccaceae sp. 1_MG-2023]|nr:SPOR domain-containing protein [Granulosicoccaceae sp. 1_MG-2023]